MLQGYEGEAKIIRRWEHKYKTPIFTAAMNHVNALRAFKVTQFAGISYSRFQNDLVVDYMTQAGFDVVEKLEGDFGVPVVCSAAALSWEIQQRLHVRQPAAGSGRLLAELP